MQGRQVGQIIHHLTLKANPKLLHHCKSLFIGKYEYRNNNANQVQLELFNRHVTMKTIVMEIRQ